MELGSSSSEISEAEPALITTTAEPSPRVRSESGAVHATARTEPAPKGAKAGNDVTAHAPSPAGSVPAAGAGGPSSTEADPPRRVLLAGTHGHTPVVLTPRVDGEVVVTAPELSRAGMPPPKRPNTRPNKALVPTSRAKAKEVQSRAAAHTQKAKANTKEREKTEVKQPPAKKRRRGRKRGPPGGWYDPPNRPEIIEEPALKMSQ